MAVLPPKLLRCPAGELRHRLAEGFNFGDRLAKRPGAGNLLLGRGRVFQTTLGHIGAKQDSSEPSVQSVGFITTLQRGVEWAATGKVTIPVPDDFPTAYDSSIRPAPTAGWPHLASWM